MILRRVQANASFGIYDILTPPVSFLGLSEYAVRSSLELVEHVEHVSEVSEVCGLIGRSLLLVKFLGVLFVSPGTTHLAGNRIKILVQRSI